MIPDGRNCEGKYVRTSVVLAVADCRTMENSNTIKKMDCMVACNFIPVIMLMHTYAETAIYY